MSCRNTKYQGQEQENTCAQWDFLSFSPGKWWTPVHRRCVWSPALGTRWAFNNGVNDSNYFHIPTHKRVKVKTWFLSRIQSFIQQSVFNYSFQKLCFQSFKIKRVRYQTWSYFIHTAVMGFEPWASLMVSQSSITNLHPGPHCWSP